MANSLKVALELGPKEKMVVAVAPEWPGLERGAKTEEEAIERLQSYRSRYARIPTLANLADEFPTGTEIEVAERYTGTGSTDFWGISFAFSDFDQLPMLDDEVDRELTVMRACWTYFDDVRSRVSVEMRKGPRGGGRDRDTIVLHVLGTEQEWANKLGVGTKQGARITDADGLEAYRERFCAAIQSYHAEGKSARNWPLRYLIRHTAYHSMDHAWEMEDKDLTGGDRTQ